MKKVDKKLIIGLVLIFFGLFGLFSAPLGAIIVILGGVALVVVGAKGTVAKNPTPKAPAARPYQPPVVPSQTQSASVSSPSVVSFSHKIPAEIDGAILRYRYSCQLDGIDDVKLGAIQSHQQAPAVLRQQDDGGVAIFAGDTLVGYVENATHARMVGDFFRDNEPVRLFFSKISGNTVFYFLLFYSRKMLMKEISLTSLKGKDAAFDDKRYENFSYISVGDYLNISFDEETEKFVACEMTIGAEVGVVPASFSEELTKSRQYVGQVVSFEDDEENPFLKIRVWY